jgi:hypothetical protein
MPVGLFSFVRAFNVSTTLEPIPTPPRRISITLDNDPVGADYLSII